VCGRPQLLVHGRSVDELKRLRQVAVAFALAFARQFAGRLPNVLRKGWFTSPSGSCTARVPSGNPANFSGTSVAVQIASSNGSAGSSFVTACEKYLLSSLLKSLLWALS